MRASVRSSGCLKRLRKLPQIAEIHAPFLRTPEIGTSGRHRSCRVPEYNSNMGRSRRFFRGMTWAGGTCCVLILIAWLWSTRNSAMYLRDDWRINLFSGQLSYEQNQMIAAVTTIRNRSSQFQPTKGQTATGAISYWSVVPVPSGLDSTYGFRGCHIAFGQWENTVILPMWMILSVAAMSTGFCAWLSRWRLRRGYCPECDYCLTGNTSGVCPECGAAITSVPTQIPPFEGADVLKVGCPPSIDPSPADPRSRRDVAALPQHS